HYYQHWGGDLTKKRAIIQGWGNVGSTAALYLSKYGVKITGIIDKEGGVLSDRGFSLEEVKKLFADKQGNKLNASDMLSFDEINKRIWTSGAEIFIPAAASRLVSRAQAESLIENDLEVVSCGANVPFQDPEIFYGPIAEYVDSKVALLPDFIANCGMARTFAYLMDPEREEVITDADIFNDTSSTIEKALLEVREQNKTSARLAQSAFSIALNKLI
ncbi:MAG: amino acid dehydrogenase, partial [Bacteroidota bacterium]